MPNLTLQLFGIPALSHPDGAPAPTTGAVKNLALLAFLTLEPGPHTREEIATLLWGDSTDEQARTSLRQALTRLKSVVGEGLTVTRQTLQLTQPPRCDVLEFLAAADQNPAAAAGFDVPRFFSGLNIRHAPGFEEWISTTRHRLLTIYSRILTRLAREAMERWQWRAAVEWAERLIGVNSSSEESYQILVEALFLVGERSLALERIQEYETGSVRESGAATSAAFRDLKRKIEAGATTNQPISEEWLARGPQLDCALVGREQEWRTLMDAWRAIRRGRSKVLLLEGEAGVGKSRLADDFTRYGSAHGAVVLRGRGYDAATGTPYGPVVEALRCGLTAPGLAGTDPEWLTEATRLLPELRRIFPALPEPLPGIDPAGRWRLYEGVAQLVMALAAESPVIVLLDDLQWCDSETCALLHFLARRWASAPVALVATLTLGELERDAPAARLCRALRVQNQAVTMTLAALSEEQVWTMVYEMGHIQGAEAGRRFAHRVYDVTRGNPFYVMELLKTMFAQGLLAAESATGKWTAGPEVLESSQPLGMPRTVQDAISERVARLPGQLRDLLATTVLAGSACETDLLSHVHGISRLHVAALCEELVWRRYLVENQGVYRVSHQLIGDVVHQELTASRRREIHRSIGLALQTIAPGEPHREFAGRIARHAEQGGERRMACRYALIASAAALGRYAPDEAMTWLDLAAANAEDQEQTDQVNRLTVEVLEFGGWPEAPTAPRLRTSTQASSLAQADLDFG
jgi:DNA-binding SARP family transcriptional activator